MSNMNWLDTTHDWTAVDDCCLFIAVGMKESRRPMANGREDCVSSQQFMGSELVEGHPETRTVASIRVCTFYEAILTIKGRVKEVILTIDLCLNTTAARREMRCCCCLLMLVLVVVLLRLRLLNVGNWDQGKKYIRRLSRA